MKIRPWLWALLMGSVLVGLTACSDSSDEVDALRTQVEELQERLDAASANASAATTTPATTRAPSTTTTEAQSTKEERDRVEEEQNWIEEQLAAFIQGNDLITTRFQARCILKRFVDARGTSGAEDLVNRVDADLNSVGRLSASDADAFLEPIVACINLVAITERDLQISNPDMDAQCMVEGLKESQVANWYRVYFVDGQADMQAVMADWLFSRIPLCQLTTTTTTTASLGHVFSEAEILSLENMCPGGNWLIPPQKDCLGMIAAAVGRETDSMGSIWLGREARRRDCTYEEVRRWMTGGVIQFKGASYEREIALYYWAEWPIRVQEDCGN